MNEQEARARLHALLSEIDAGTRDVRPPWQRVVSGSVLAAAVSISACDRKPVSEDRPVYGGPDPSPAESMAPAYGVDTPEPVPTPLYAAVMPDGGAPSAPEGREPPEGRLGRQFVEHCVDQCIQDNQMRAVSPEQINEDCRIQCAGICKMSCKNPKPADPAQLKRCSEQCDHFAGM